MTWPILATKKANRSHTSQITWRTQQYWCVQRPASKEVRHLEEKSSRGFRFLRHRHKHKVLLQELNSWRTHPNGTLRHQWTQEPNNCDKQTVISVPMADRQKQNVAQQRNPPPKPQIWWISTKAVSNQTTIWHHQPLTRVKWFEPLQAHHLTSLISEHSDWREIHFRNKIWWTSTKGIHSRKTRTAPNNQWVWWNTRTLIHQQKVDSIQRSYP